MKLEEKAMPEQDKQKRRMSYAMRDSLSLTLLAVSGIVLLFIFNYLPMYGLSVAFKQFNPNFGIWKSPWVGWDNFEFFFTSQDAWRVLRNTVLYSLDFMFVGLVFAVLVALLLYNMRSQVGVKVYNTVMILPKFLSMVLIAFIVYSILNPASGILNQIIRDFGGDGKTACRGAKLCGRLFDLHLLLQTCNARIFCGLCNGTCHSVFYNGVKAIRNDVFRRKLIFGYSACNGFGSGNFHGIVNVACANI